MKRTALITMLLFIPFIVISQSLEELNKPTISELDEIAPFSEGLAGVRRGNQWGFMDDQGQLIIDFRNDIAWNPNADTTKQGIQGLRFPQFKEGLCIIQKLTDEGIPQYGFLDKEGKQVIEPEFINITPFEKGKAIGIYGKKSFRGKNEFQLNIYDYNFTEVVINKEGEMVWPIQQRINIFMSKKRFELPNLNAKILSKDLLIVKGSNNQWKVVKTKMSTTTTK